VKDATTAPLGSAADIAAFDEKDARYIQSAAAKIRKPGDCVVVESQHQSLRDHYIKQILSIAFSRTPGLVIQRCGKERDWMIARLNRAIDSAERSEKTAPTGAVREIWVLELSGTEDFDLFKLGHTLTNQFASAGISLLVSCSQVIAESIQFSRYLDRLGIPMWRFGMPDERAMLEFLNRESEHGAVNQARQLIAELETARSDNEIVHRIEAPIKKETLTNSRRSLHASESLPPQLIEKVQDPAEVIDLTIAARTMKSPLRKTEGVAKRTKLPARKALDEPNQPRSVVPSETTLLMLCAIGLSLVLTLGLVAVLFEIPVYRMFKELAQTTSSSFVVDIKPSEIEPKSEVVQPAETIEQIKEPASSIGAASEHELANRLEAQIADPVSQGLGSKKQDSSLTGSFNDAPSKFGQSENLNDQVAGSTESELQTIEGQLPSTPVVEEDRIFAQFGAFSNRATAAKFRLQIQEMIPEAFVVEKTNGMWGIVSGPYASRGLVPEKISDSSIKPYFISDSDLTMKI
jgi:hypothetical protein